MSQRRSGRSDRGRRRPSARGSARDHAADGHQPLLRGPADAGRAAAAAGVPLHALLEALNRPQPARMTTGDIERSGPGPSGTGGAESCRTTRRARGHPARPGAVRPHHGRGQGAATEEALVLRAPFEPIPLYDVLGKRGFAHWAERRARRTTGRSGSTVTPRRGASAAHDGRRPARGAGRDGSHGRAGARAARSPWCGCSRRSRRWRR